MLSSDSDSDASFVPKRRKLKKHPRQVEKHNKDAGHKLRSRSLSFDPLLYPPGGNTVADSDHTFDEAIERFLPEYLKTRQLLQEKESEYDEEGTHLRSLTRSEVSSLLSEGTHNISPLLLRILKLRKEKRRSHIAQKKLIASTSPLHPTQSVQQQVVHRPQVVQALEEIQTTPPESSLLSRLHGTWGSSLSGLIAVDWDTITPWMSLMRDIRDHYRLAHPERHQPVDSLAPITYRNLQPCHLSQIHDLLERFFWTGIDVSDSLDYSPEKCTVVACYKRLVVGVTILSSPQETYITYLAVKPGWDKAQIARTMLFHLIKMNPRRDITLHVSVNNSAMLLYNQFGFKAEEFIAGFYEDYLDPASWASKNAFRLRLRQ